MAIVNLTPDSFYASSRSVGYESACRAVAEAVEQGADIIDLGAYSSRPGAEHIDTREEWRRLSIGLEAVRRVGGGVRVSVDTFRSDIVRRCYEELGDFMVNDISAGEFDSDMVAIVASLGLEYVAMHMRGTPQTMNSMCGYERGVASEVEEYLLGRRDELVAQGVDARRIILDPGFGFAKQTEDNWRLWAAVEPLSRVSRVLVGVSRKSMIYRPLGCKPEDVLPASLALVWEALSRGADILRVHDVGATRQVVDMFNYYKTVCSDD